VLLESSNGSSDCIVAATNVTAAGTYTMIVKDVVSESAGFDFNMEASEYAFTFVRASDGSFSDADSGALASGTPRAGSVSIGDADVYRFSVTSGVSYTINLAETSTSGFDPAFTIYNPAGTLVTSQTGAASATFIQANPTVSGTYTVVVYDNDGLESGPYSIALNSAVGTDNFAPSMLHAEYRYNTAPPEVRVIFSESVETSFSITDVQIIDRATGTPVGDFLLSSVYESANDLFKISFPASPGRVLPDGNYRLHVNAADITDAAGNPLGAAIDFDFFVLAGDANRDRTVDITDLGILATNWQKSNRVFSQGDFNYDGTVDITDLGILATNWQKNVPVPARPAPSAARTATVKRGSPFAATNTILSQRPAQSRPIDDVLVM
jgi:hypothetical protein